MSEEFALSEANKSFFRREIGFNSEVIEMGYVDLHCRTPGSSKPTKHNNILAVLYNDRHRHVIKFINFIIGETVEEKEVTNELNYIKRGKEVCHSITYKNERGISTIGILFGDADKANFFYDAVSEIIQKMKDEKLPNGKINGSSSLEDRKKIFLKNGGLNLFQNTNTKSASSSNQRPPLKSRPPPGLPLSKSTFSPTRAAPAVPRSLPKHLAQQSNSSQLHLSRGKPSSTPSVSSPPIPSAHKPSNQQKIPPPSLPSSKPRSFVQNIDSSSSDVETNFNPSTLSHARKLSQNSTNSDLSPITPNRSQATDDWNVGTYDPIDSSASVPERKVSNTSSTGEVPPIPEKNTTDKKVETGRVPKLPMEYRSKTSKIKVARQLEDQAPPDIDKITKDATKTYVPKNRKVPRQIRLARNTSFNAGTNSSTDASGQDLQIPLEQQENTSERVQPNDFNSGISKKNNSKAVHSRKPDFQQHSEFGLNVEEQSGPNNGFRNQTNGFSKQQGIESNERKVRNGYSTIQRSVLANRRKNAGGPTDSKTLDSRRNNSHGNKDQFSPDDTDEELPPPPPEMLQDIDINSKFNHGNNGFKTGNICPVPQRQFQKTTSPRMQNKPAGRNHNSEVSNIIPTAPAIPAKGIKFKQEDSHTKGGRDDLLAAIRNRNGSLRKVPQPSEGDDKCRGRVEDLSSPKGNESLNSLMATVLQYRKVRVQEEYRLGGDEEDGYESDDWQ